MIYIYRMKEKWTLYRLPVITMNQNLSILAIRMRHNNNIIQQLTKYTHNKCIQVSAAMQSWRFKLSCCHWHNKNNGYENRKILRT